LPHQEAVVIHILAYNTVREKIRQDIAGRRIEEKFTGLFQFR